MKKILVSTVAASFLLAGCVHDMKMDNETIGTGAGVVIGGLVGSMFGQGSGKYVAALVGAGLGGLIGNQLGQMLDEKEQAAMADATVAAAETGKTGERIAWSAPVEAPPVAPAPPPAAAPKAKAAKAKAPAKPEPAAWVAPAPAKPAASGWVIPKAEAYTREDGQVCRDMTQVAVKDGKEVSDDVTLCKVAKGGGSQWVVPAS